MSKISKSNLVILLTGISCICLIIGGYLAFTGLESQKNQQSLVDQLNQANETNQGLQENLTTLKEMLVDQQSINTDDGPSATYTYEKLSREDIIGELDPVTGNLLNEMYPIGLDVTSINYLKGYGINAYTIKSAYIHKLETEGYPEELNGYGLLQQVELLDAHTCMVKLSGETEDLRIIYTLDYEIGIEFTEVKKELSTRLNVHPSNLDLTLDSAIIGVSARYNMTTLELLGSEYMIGNQFINYSPDHKYMTIINYDPRSMFIGYMNSNDFKPKLVVKDIETQKIIVNELINDLNDPTIIWSLDSQKFIFQNTLYDDMNNIKTQSLKNENENFELVSTTITKDYIIKLGIEIVKDGVNLLVCKVVDWNNKSVDEVTLFETPDMINIHGNVNGSFGIKTLYDNTIELNYYFANGSDIYIIEAKQEDTTVTKVDSYLEVYQYIPEYNLKMREVSSLGSEGGITLIFEDYDGNEVFKTDYSDMLLLGYLGADANLGQLYFRSSIGTVYNVGQSSEEFNLIVYNIEADNFYEIQVPTDHLNKSDIVEGMFNWPLRYSQGVLEVVTIIPLGEEKETK